MKCDGFYLLCAELGLLVERNSERTGLAYTDTLRLAVNELFAYSLFVLIAFQTLFSLAIVDTWKT